jgi:hypothetical protein
MGQGRRTIREPGRGTLHDEDRRPMLFPNDKARSRPEKGNQFCLGSGRDVGWTKVGRNSHHIVMVVVVIVVIVVPLPIVVVMMAMAKGTVGHRTLLSMLPVAMLVEGDHRRPAAVAEIANPTAEGNNPRESHDGQGGEETLDKDRTHGLGKVPGEASLPQALFRGRLRVQVQLTRAPASSIPSRAGRRPR